GAACAAGRVGAAGMAPSGGLARLAPAAGAAAMSGASFQFKARHKRLALALLGATLLGLAAWFVLSAFQKNLVFFFTPSQIQAGEAPLNRRFRIGGMVEVGSLQRLPDGMSYHFVVTDRSQRVSVQYKGLLPDLFKEGKGV